MKTMHFIGAAMLAGALSSSLFATPVEDGREKVAALANKAGVELAASAPVWAALRSQKGQSAADSASRVLADSIQVAARVAQEAGAACPLVSNHGLSLEEAKGLLAEASNSKLSVSKRAESLIHAAGAIRQAQLHNGGTQQFNRSVPTQSDADAKLALSAELVKAAQSVLAAK